MARDGQDPSSELRHRGVGAKTTTAAARSTALPTQFAAPSSTGELQVIGAGFGRTGTLSLTQALNELGYRSYHMYEALKVPGLKHLEQWAARGATQRVDLMALLDGYTATTDFPSCLHYVELLQLNPKAKVVLTVRDADKWYDSASQTIFAVAEHVNRAWLVRRIPYFARLGRLMEWSYIVPAFGGSARLKEREHCLAIYRQHIEAVKRNVPADRLLIFDVKEGWEPLCRFLGKPVPSTPFPNVNDNAQFRRQFFYFSVADWALVSLLLAAVGAIAYAGSVAWATSV